MEYLLFGIDLVLPLFLVILLGVYLRKKDILNNAATISISSLVFNVALPAKLFSDTINTDFTKILDIKFISFAIIAVLLSFLLVFIIVPIFVKDNKQASAMIHAGFRGNFVFIGIPLIENILGKSPVVQASLIIVFVIPLYNILGVFVLSYFNKKSKGIKISSLLLDIIKNPMIIAILAALPFSVLQIEFPNFVNVTLNILARMSTPLALLLIGAGLSLKVLKGEYGKIISMALYKTVFQPLIFMTLAIKMDFSVEAIVTLFILFATPSANNVYVLTKKMGGDADLAASITVVSLILTIITLPIGISLLGSAGIL